MFLSFIGGDLSTYIPAPLICCNTMLKGLNSTIEGIWFYLFQHQVVLHIRSRTATAVLGLGK